MTENYNDSNDKHITLVHGSMHGAWVWDYLKGPLDNLGYDVSTPDLPIDEPHTFEDMAEIISDDVIAQGRETELVLHSRAINWGIRVPDLVKEKIGEPLVRNCVFVGAALDDKFAENITTTETKPPIKSSIIFEISKYVLPKFVVFDEETGKYIFDPAKEDEVKELRDHFKNSFYRDCPLDIKDWAGEQLRPQYYGEPAFESPLQKLPDVPSVSIVLKEDGAIDQARQIYSARYSTKSRITDFRSSHSPMLAYPNKFAVKLDKELQKQARLAAAIR